MKGSKVRTSESNCKFSGTPSPSLRDLSQKAHEVKEVGSILLKEKMLEAVWEGETTLKGKNRMAVGGRIGGGN